MKLEGKDYDDIKVEYQGHPVRPDGYIIVNGVVQLTQMGRQFIKSLYKKAQQLNKDNGKD